MHKYLKLMSALIAAGLFASTHVYAEDSAKTKQIEEKFKAADKNADGKLTLEEAKEGMPRVARAFTKIDVNNQGYVTVDEIKAKAE